MLPGGNQNGTFFFLRSKNVMELPNGDNDESQNVII